MQIPGKPRHKTDLQKRSNECKANVGSAARNTTEARHEFEFIELKYKMDHRRQAGQVSKEYRTRPGGAKQLQVPGKPRHKTDLQMQRSRSKYIMRHCKYRANPATKPTCRDESSRAKPLRAPVNTRYIIRHCRYRANPDTKPTGRDESSRANPLRVPVKTKC